MNNYTSTNSERNEYPLEWLDSLITRELNPQVNPEFSIGEQDAINLIQQLADEEIKLQSLIKSQVFALSTKGEIQLLITRYYSALIILLNQCLLNQKSTGLPKASVYHTVVASALVCLNGLFVFIETRFSPYLTLDERVPATYLNVMTKELRRRLLNVKRKSEKAASISEVMQIVLNSLLRFTNADKPSYEITFKNLHYVDIFVSKLEQLKWDDDTIWADLNDLIFYLNFNSKAYVKAITSHIAAKVESSDDKLETLLFYYKIFKQHHHRQDLVFNPKFHDLETIMDNWFREEIGYYERILSTSTGLRQSDAPLRKKLPKVMCALSSDQLALIIRSADELRIVIAKSMNEVFKTLVPHLSTPFKDDLSFDAVRSKAYIAEEKDKKIAIEALERMIRKIKGY